MQRCIRLLQLQDELIIHHLCSDMGTDLTGTGLQGIKDKILKGIVGADLQGIEGAELQDRNTPMGSWCLYRPSKGYKTPSPSLTAT